VTKRGWALFAAMGVIWGVPYLLIKVAVADLSPTTLVMLRTGIGALLLVPLAAWRGELAPVLRHWRILLVYTVIEIVGPWVLLSNAERRLSSSLSGLLIAAVPLIGAVLVLVVGGDERLDLRRGLGLVIGFLGVAALLGLDLSVIDLGAVAQVGLVTLGYAIGPMIVATRLSHVPALGVVALSLLVTALVCAPIGVAQLPHAPPPARVVGAVAVLGLVCTAFAFVLFFALIAEVGPQRAYAITYVNPAVALALGILVLGEPFTVGAGVGFVLILVGLALATRRRPAGAAEQPPEERREEERREEPVAGGASR
jgi:drug/metabolite transporter (DMT)-like permease